MRTVGQFQIKRHRRGEVHSLRVSIKDLSNNTPWLDNIAQLCDQPGHWRIWHHRRARPIIHVGTLKSAIALYLMTKP